MRLIIVICLGLELASGQLRPRRVGVAATGEQDLGGDLGGLDSGNSMGASALQEGMKLFTDAMGADPEAALANLANNPMIKGMMDANPEMANLMANPEGLAEKMQEVMKLMASDEGREMTAKIMNEMQSVLTDPQKMKEGLEQFASNPMLKGMAEAMPELKEVLDDPEKMEEAVSQASQMFSNLGGAGMGEGGLGEMLKGVGGMEGLLNNPELMAESMKQAQKMMAAMGSGGDGANMAELLAQLGGGGGEDGDDLQARVRQQMASMMGNEMGDDEF